MYDKSTATRKPFFKMTGRRRGGWRWALRLVYSPSAPMIDDRTAVLEANAAFYRAFESLDLRRMEEVWVRVPYIKCVHPGWGLLVGWGPVMESWQQIFANTALMRFKLTHVQAEVTGDLAWVVLTREYRNASPRQAR